MLVQKNSKKFDDIFTRFDTKQVFVGQTDKPSIQLSTWPTARFAIAWRLAAKLANFPALLREFDVGE